MSHVFTKTRSDVPTTPSTENQPSSNREAESARQPRSSTTFAQVERQFVSFDGGVTAKGTLQLPDRYRFWASSNFSDSRPQIARGAGLSYAAASFAENVNSIDHRYFNRIIEFQQEAGVIEVEAGITLGALYRFLAPRGLFLPTQPGHPSITVGGCIAADVHGKNQFRDGTFLNQVLELTLFHPDHGLLQLSPRSNAELFRLTCGGYGLTGNILTARLKLRSIPSTMADVTLIPVADISRLPDCLRESAARSDFVFSWHDFSPGAGFGSGFIQEGKFASLQCRIDKEEKLRRQKLSADNRGDWMFPLFNQYSLKLLNLLYGGRARLQRGPVRLSLFDSVFPIQNTKEMYFKFFGAAGFYEYQLLLPAERLCQFVTGVHGWLSKHSSLPVTLASAKVFSGRQDLLRFSGEGICLCLDFPRCSESADFLLFLDSLMLSCAGIPNIIKDSRLPLNIVQAAYPEYDKFRRMLHEFDPRRRYQSELSMRLGL